MQDIYYPSSDGKTTIHACLWLPDGEAVGVVQIIHGMAEYAKRYSPTAEFLTKRGFIVCANDHLGHGQSVNSKDDLGWFNEERSTDMVISDIRTLHLKVKAMAENAPYFIFGHSMGSFFCRKYISLYGKELSGAIIMGTGFKGKLMLNFALAFTKLNALFFGWRNKSKFIKSLAFGGYNKKIKSAKTKNDWLSVNGENVSSYEVDELCGFDFTDNGYSILFGILKQACSSKTINAVPKDLPVLFVAGERDPVGDYGKGVKKINKKFIKAGVKDVNIILYPDFRHELLNDHCKDKVLQDILEFINNRMDNNNG